MRWTGQTWSVLSLGLVAVALSACLVAPFGGERPGAEPDRTPRSSASVDPMDDEVDGTTTIAEFQRDVEAAVRIAQRYWTEGFASSGDPFPPIRRVVPYQRAGEVECAGTPVPRNNAVYCSAGDFIAYDVEWALAAFRMIGDAFLFYMLGHEYAHGVQVRLGIRYEFTIEQELQADCMAGAYLGDSVRAGILTLDDGDLDELRTGLLAVADEPGQPWFAEGSHGTVEQRTEAFFAGYKRSLPACNVG